MRKIVGVGAAFAVALALAACGSDKDSGGGSDAGGTPKCDAIVGKPASALSDGCLGDDGSIEATVSFDCQDGARKLYASGTGDRMWWALSDGVVKSGPESEYNGDAQPCVYGRSEPSASPTG